MEVYFNGNFWGNGKEKPEQAGREIKVQREFEWGKDKGFIPAVYQCEEGLVADLCFRIERARIEAYYDKWDEKARTGTLTGEESEQMEQDNPFQMNFRASAVINKWETEPARMCSIGWCPAGLGNEIMEEESEELMDYYQCSRDFGWLFVRISFPWVRWSGAGIQSLQLKLEEGPVPHTAGYFSVDPSGIGRSVAAEHPVSGEPYTVRICGCEQEKIEWDKGEVGMGMEFPVCYQVISYQTEPDFPSEKFRIQDCAASDQPRFKKEETVCADRSRAVSVIGGQDGPTSVFIAGKTKQVPDVHQACSAVHFEEMKKVDWKMVFYEKEKEDLRIDVICVR